MDLPKKISGIDKKTSSTSSKMQKSSRNTIEALPSKLPKPRVTAGESLKNAVDLYFQRHDLHTPHVSQSKIRTNNVPTRKSIQKTQSKEKSRLPSVSSKSLRNSEKIGAVESKRSVVGKPRLQSVSSKNLGKTVESAIDVSNIVAAESQQSNVTEIESIAEENELVIDLTSLINEEREISFEPNLPAPRSMGSFLNFIGPPHPENNAEGSRENRIEPPNRPINSSNGEHTATQLDSSLTQSRYSSIDNSATINQQHQDNMIQQLRESLPSGSSVYEDALSDSQGCSANNHAVMDSVQTDGAHCQTTNVNNLFRTQNSMPRCINSVNHKNSNTTVACVTNNITAYVVPIPQQQVVIHI